MTERRAATSPSPRGVKPGLVFTGGVDHTPTDFALRVMIGLFISGVVLLALAVILIMSSDSPVPGNSPNKYEPNVLSEVFTNIFSPFSGIICFVLGASFLCVTFFPFFETIDRQPINAWCWLLHHRSKNQKEGDIKENTGFTPVGFGSGARPKANVEAGISTKSIKVVTEDEEKISEDRLEHRKAAASPNAVGSILIA